MLPVLTMIITSTTCGGGGGYAMGFVGTGRTGGPNPVGTLKFFCPLPDRGRGCRSRRLSVSPTADDRLRKCSPDLPRNKTIAARGPLSIKMHQTSTV